MTTLTPRQLDALTGHVSRPTYLIDLNFLTLEHLSTNGDFDIDGVHYSGGDAGLPTLGDWTAAVVRIAATPARAGWLTAPDWRGQECRISLLAVQQLPQFWAMDYTVPDYGEQGLVAEVAFVMLDGVLTGGRLTGQWIELEVSHRALLRRYTPRIRIAPPICNHLPAAGDIIKWVGGNYTLESRLDN